MQRTAVGRYLWVLLGVLILPQAGWTASPVATTEVVFELLESEQSFEGVVESKYQSTVSSQTVGTIEEINFDVDDVVAAGSVILRFRDVEQRARYREEEANLKVAQVRRLEAEDAFKRATNLLAKKLTSQADFDRAKAAFDTAVAQHEQAKARLTQAKEQLDYTVVKAPYSGVMVARHVQRGESVQVGQPLATGFSLADLRVVTAVPQSLIEAVRPLTHATIIAAGQRIEGTSLTIFPYANGVSHTFRVRVDLPKNSQAIYPGTFVKVLFNLGKKRHRLVASRAVVQRGEVTGVYLVKEGVVTALRYVVVGRQVGDRVEVLAGLDEGEVVALDPVAAGIALKAQAR